MFDTLVQWKSTLHNLLEKDNALEWSQRAYTQHDDGLSDIKIDPLLATLRTDARYASLLKKLGLPE